MKKVFFILSFLFSTIVFCQTQNYDVLILGVDVGDLDITKTSNGVQKFYLMKSSTRVGLRKDVCIVKLDFENNILISSSFENKKNGKLNSYTYVTKVGVVGYKVQTEKGLSSIAGVVSSCCYDIFFIEPKGGESLFSERWGKFATITQVDDHSYKLAVKGENDCTYNFVNGKMVKMEVQIFLGKCKLVLK